MKKVLLFLTTVLMVWSCNRFDDSAIWEELREHDSRIAELETLCTQMNTNISSLQAVVVALQNNDYVTNISPIKEGGKEIGYTLTFSKSGTITIYHGKDGKDGADGKDGENGKDGEDGKDGANGKDGEDGKDGADGKDGEDGKDGVNGQTPAIGVKQDTDGVWYWTLNGTWMLDEEGNKIPATGSRGEDGEDGKDGEDGEDGKDGKDGEDGKDGITPVLKIEDDYWYISYDNGNTWERLGKATGDDGANGLDGVNGDAFFDQVYQDDRYVYFILNDGTNLVIPKMVELDIAFDMSDLKGLRLNSEVRVRYYVSSTSPSVHIEVMPTNDLRAEVISSDSTNKNGEILIRTGNSYDSASKVLVFVTDNDKVIMKSISVVVNPDSEAAQLYVYNGAVKNISSTGGMVTLSFLTNVECEVVIPDEDRNWISIVESKSLELDYIRLNVSENISDRRNSIVKVESVDGKLSVEYTIIQASAASSGTPSLDADGSIVGKPAANEIYYVSNNKSVIKPASMGAAVISNTYDAGVGVIVFDRDLTSVGGFRDTPLKEISIPEGVKSISASAFRDCDYLVNVTIPSTVRTINNSAFESCAKLKSIVIPEGVEKLDYSVFSFCSSLESIYIPSTLTLIQTESYSDKSGTFAYCPALKKVYINDLKSWLELSCSYEACPTYNGADLYLNGELLSEVTIPEDVTEIKGSFYNCTSITSVTFPDNIATFPSSLFSHCPNLTFVRLPSSLTVIPNAAFNSCTSLLEIDIPDQVTSMEGSTFYGCSSLKKVTIGSGLKTFSSSEFSNCYFLNDIYIKAPVPPVYKYTSSTQNLFSNIGNDVTIYVPAESVEDYKKSPSFSNYADDIVGYDVE